MWLVDGRAAGAEYGIVSARIAQADQPADRHSRKGKIIVRFVSATGAAFFIRFD